MNSKSGEEQKKVITSVKVLISTQNRVQSKKSQNDNTLMLGRVSINTRTRPSNVLILGRVLDSAPPYWPYCELKLMHYIGLSV